MGTKPERAFVIYSSGERDLTSGTRAAAVAYNSYGVFLPPTTDYIYKYIRVWVGGCVYTGLLVSAVGGREG